MTAHFWAIAVADVERLAQWYSRVFDLEADKPFDGADGSRVIVLRGPELMIELKQRAQHSTRSAEADGYFKTGWFVADVRAEHDRLVSAGAMPILAVADQPELGLRFGIVADPEGNLIQLFENLSA